MDTIEAIRMYEEMRRWERMETDCLVNIFSRLGLDDLTVGVPFVCKSWHKVSVDPLCWRTLDFQGLDFMPWSDLAKRFASHYGMARFSFPAFLRAAVQRSCRSAVDLRFPHVSGCSLEDFVYVSNECPKLKVLVLHHVMSKDEARIPEIVGKLEDLEHLEIESKPSSFCEMVRQLSLRCKNFRRLKISGGFNQEDASAMVEFLPKLKSLNLSRSYIAKDQLFVILDGCRELEWLSVKNCIGFVVDDGFLKRASSIKTLEHQGCRLMDECGYDSDDGYDCFYVLVI